MNDEETTTTRFPFPSFLGGSNLGRPGSVSGIPHKNGFTGDTSIQNREVGVYVFILLLSATALMVLLGYLLFECLKCRRDLFRKSSTKPGFETVPSSEPIPHPKRIYEIQAEEGYRPRLPTWPGKLPLGVQSLPSGLGNTALSASCRSANASTPSSSSSKRVETGSFERLGRCKKEASITGSEPCVLVENCRSMGAATNVPA